MAVAAGLVCIASAAACICRLDHPAVALLVIFSLSLSLSRARSLYTLCKLILVPQAARYISSSSRNRQKTLIGRVCVWVYVVYCCVDSMLLRVARHMSHALSGSQSFLVCLVTDRAFGRARLARAVVHVQKRLF